LERTRRWVSEALRPSRLRPALVAAAVVVLCALSLYLTVGPYLFGPQPPSALVGLTVEELEALADVLPTEAEGDLLGEGPVDSATLRELIRLSPEELDRLLRTL
jgi:hypothetical protein